MRLFKKSIYIFVALLSLSLALVSFVGCDVYMSGLATRLETEVVDGGLLAVTGLQEEAKSSPCIKLEIPSTIDGRTVVRINENAFMGYDNIVSVTIGDGIKEIGDYAFSDCSRLTSITVGKNVTKIGTEAFYGCPLTSAVIPTSAIDYIEKDELESLTITRGESVPSWSFAYCDSLKDVTVKDEVEFIGNHAFYDCTRLTNLSLSPTVKTIEYDAFFNCPIENATLSTSAIEHINTRYLRTITINGGEQIYAGTFRLSDKLTSVTVGDTVTEIGNNAFNNCISLAEVNLPSNLASIGEYSFKGCVSLEEISFNDNLKHIGNYAFEGCTSLSIAVLPSGLISVGSSAFKDCSALKEVFIPSSVTELGNYAFQDCPELTIYTQAKENEIGEGWAYYWNIDMRPVVWNFTEE